MAVKKAQPKKKKATKKVDPYPVNTNFNIEIPAYPDLEEQVVSFNYDLCQKTFTIMVLENTNLDAFDWVSTIKDKYDAAKQHKHMATQDMVVFKTLDQNNEELAVIRFAKLILRHHSVGFHKNSHSDFGITTPDQPLLHTFTASFERCEKDKDQ